MKVSSATSAEEWDAFVAANAGATGYHLWRWRYVFERAFGHDTEYLIARRDGHVVGVLPLVIFRSWLFGRFAVSLPFVNYGGIVADDEAAAHALLDRAIDIARLRRLGHVELRHDVRKFDGLPNKRHKAAMLLPLSHTVDQAWESLDRKVRNQVRKAEKSGLTVESGGRELLPAFYGVFRHNMRDLGTPVYSRRLFKEVFNQFPAATRVFVVKRDATMIAAGITYQDRNGVEVPWASSLAKYRAWCPNNLLYWRVIKWAVEQGLHTLDFGRSTPDEGTYQVQTAMGSNSTSVVLGVCAR